MDFLINFLNEYRAVFFWAGRIGFPLWTLLVFWVAIRKRGLGRPEDWSLLLIWVVLAFLFFWTFSK
jgi:hypothetical protein